MRRKKTCDVSTPHVVLLLSPTILACWAANFGAYWGLSPLCMRATAHARR